MTTQARPAALSGTSAFKDLKWMRPDTVTMPQHSSADAKRYSLTATCERIDYTKHRAGVSPYCSDAVKSDMRNPNMTNFSQTCSCASKKNVHDPCKRRDIAKVYRPLKNNAPAGTNMSPIHPLSSCPPIGYRFAGPSRRYCWKKGFSDDVPLGSGYSSTVYRGIDTVTGEAVAVKHIAKEKQRAMSTDSYYKKLYHRLPMDPHPSLIRIRSFFEDSDSFYIVTDLCRGPDLINYVIKFAGEQIPLHMIRTVIYQILLGLQHMHKLHIIHRDVKLDNVLFKDMSLTQIVIVDFDMAIMQDYNKLPRVPPWPDKFIIAGTQDYMAPESYKGKYSEASDMWGVGVVLYIMLLGKFPFRCDAKNCEKIPSGMKKVEIRESVRARCPAGADLLKKLLTYDIKCRLISASEALKHPWFHDMNNQTPKDLKVNRRNPVLKAKQLNTCGSPTFVKDDTDTCTTIASLSIMGQSGLSTRKYREISHQELTKLHTERPYEPICNLSQDSRLSKPDAHKGSLITNSHNLSQETLDSTLPVVAHSTQTTSQQAESTNRPLVVSATSRFAPSSSVQRLDQDIVGGKSGISHTCRNISANEPLVPSLNQKCGRQLISSKANYHCSGSREEKFHSIDKDKLLNTKSALDHRTLTANSAASREERFHKEIQVMSQMHVPETASPSILVNPPAKGEPNLPSSALPGMINSHITKTRQPLIYPDAEHNINRDSPVNYYFKFHSSTSGRDHNNPGKASYCQDTSISFGPGYTKGSKVEGNGNIPFPQTTDCSRLNADKFTITQTSYKNSTNQIKKNSAGLNSTKNQLADAHRFERSHQKNHVGPKNVNAGIEKPCTINEIYEKISTENLVRLEQIISSQYAQDKTNDPQKRINTKLVHSTEKLGCTNSETVKWKKAVDCTSFFKDEYAEKPTSRKNGIHSEIQSKPVSVVNSLKTVITPSEKVSSVNSTMNSSISSSFTDRRLAGAIPPVHDFPTRRSLKTGNTEKKDVKSNFPTRKKNTVMSCNSVTQDYNQDPLWTSFQMCQNKAYTRHFSADSGIRVQVQTKIEKRDKEHLNSPEIKYDFPSARQKGDEYAIRHSLASLVDLSTTSSSARAHSDMQHRLSELATLKTSRRNHAASEIRSHRSNEQLHGISANSYAEPIGNKIVDRDTKKKQNHVESPLTRICTGLSKDRINKNKAELKSNTNMKVVSPISNFDALKSSPDQPTADMIERYTAVTTNHPIFGASRTTGAALLTKRIIASSPLITARIQFAQSAMSITPRP